jgi:integrase
MASSPEHRGESVRISWLLGGRRGGAKQSVTFSGDPAEDRMKLALAAKAFVEARGHNVTREQCYAAILGPPDEPVTIVPTFQQWAKEWIADLRRAKRVQQDVARRYEQYLELRAVPYFGARLLTEITRDDVKAWVASMRSSRVTQGNKSRRPGSRLLSAQTITKQFMIASACLAAAVPKWIPVNPAAPLPGERKNSIGLPPLGPSNGMFLTATEVELILDECPPELHDLVFVAVRTGLRMGELIELRAQHILFPRSGGATILVRRGRKSDGTAGEPKSPASRRDIPVVGRAAEVLARRVQGRRPAAYVFTTGTGARWQPSNLRARYWYRAVAAAQRCPQHPPASPPRPTSGPTRKLRNDEISACGCPGVLTRRPRFHDLRHTHASVLIANGWHFKKVQRRLGHARFQTTMDVYGHLVDLGGDEELEGLEDFFSPGTQTRTPADRPTARQVAVQRRHQRRLVRHATSGQLRSR